MDETISFMQRNIQLSSAYATTMARLPRHRPDYAITMARLPRRRSGYAITMARLPRRRSAYAITMARLPRRRSFDGQDDKLHCEAFLVH